MNLKDFLGRNKADIDDELAQVIHAEFDKSVQGMPYRLANVPEHLQKEFLKYVKNEQINRRSAGELFTVKKGYCAI